MECPVTGRLLPDGFVVHPDCADRFRAVGASLVRGVVDDVEAVRDKRVSPGVVERSGGVPSPRLLIRPGVFYPVEEAEDTFRVWADAVFQFVRPGCGVNASVVSWRVIGLLFFKYALELCRFVDAPVMLDEVEDALARCFKVMDPAQPLRVVKCIECGGAFYYEFDLQSLPCQLCGALISRPLALEQMREDSLDVLVPLQVAVQLLRERGYVFSDSTVRSWVKRGKLPLHEGRKVFPRDLLVLLDNLQR